MIYADCMFYLYFSEQTIIIQLLIYSQEKEFQRFGDRDRASVVFANIL